MTTLNLQLPSDAWQEYGKTKTVEPDGLLKDKPVSTSYGPTQPQAPVSYGPQQSPSVQTTPTVGSVMGTAPLTRDQQIADIRNKALAIQAQIPGATSGTKKFNAPTPEGEVEQPWTPLTAKQERDIQRAQMKLFQKEIDATNQIYDEMLRQERIAGQGRLGSVGAMGARAGILGSDFQGAQEESTRKDTASIIGGVQAERAAKIGNIMGTVRKAAADEIAAKNKANKEGAEAKIKFMAERQDRNNRNINKFAAALIAQGLNPDDLSKEQLDEAIKAGMTEENIRAEYDSLKFAKDAEDKATDLSTRKTEADIAKINSDIARGKLIEIGEGTMLYNFETSETFKNPKTSTPSTSGGGAGSGTSPYGSDLDAVIGSATLMIPSKFGQENFQRQLASARSDEDRLNLVAGVVLKSQSADMRNDFTNLKTGVNQINKAISMLDSGTKTGLLQNGAQYVFNAFGEDYDPKLAEIRSNIVAAVQPYRNSVTGAAWGAQEESEYQALFGSNKYSPEELRNRLETMKGILQDKQSSVLNSFVNPMGYYENPYETQGTSYTEPETTGDPEYDAYLQLINGNN